MNDQRKPIEADELVRVFTDGDFTGKLDIGESVAFSVNENGSQRVVARQTNGTWRIESDGVNVIEGNTVSFGKIWETKLAEQDMGLPRESLVIGARYRVLLERIDG